jgi:Na+-driven multidrug efflux pump
MFSTIGASIIHWILAYYLAVDLDMKMTGVAIASSIHFVFRTLISYLCVKFDKDLSRGLISLRHEDSWKGFGDAARLGGNSILLKVMGWWAFDVFTQLAAWLTVSELAGQTILRNIGLFTYMIPVGLSQAVNFLTGKYLGMNKVTLAHKISGMCMWVTFTWSFLSMALVFFGKQPIFDFYTKDQDVQTAMERAWYILTIFVFFDCMQGVAAGNISGLGLMRDVRFVTAFNYWVLGIPLSVYTMFKLDMGLEGLWYGPTIACLMNYIMYEYKIHSCDW